MEIQAVNESGRSVSIVNLYRRSGSRTGAPSFEEQNVPCSPRGCRYVTRCIIKLRHRVRINAFLSCVRKWSCRSYFEFENGCEVYTCIFCSSPVSWVNLQKKSCHGIGSWAV